MQVTVEAKKQEHKNLLETLAAFSVVYLNLSKSTYTLSVSLQKNLTRETDSWGMAGHIDKEVYVAIDSRASLSQTMQTFAHEMVHVKQIATGLLKFKDGSIFWRGTNLSHLPYLSRPWEIQAIKETPLLVQHFEQFILNNLSGDE